MEVFRSRHWFWSTASSFAADSKVDLQIESSFFYQRPPIVYLNCSTFWAITNLCLISISAKSVANVLLVSSAVFVPLALLGAMTMMMNRRSCIVRPKLVGWDNRAMATCLCWTEFSMHLNKFLLLFLVLNPSPRYPAPAFWVASLPNLLTFLLGPLSFLSPSSLSIPFPFPFLMQCNASNQIRAFVECTQRRAAGFLKKLGKRFGFGDSRGNPLEEEGKDLQGTNPGLVIVESSSHSACSAYRLDCSR